MNSNIYTVSPKVIKQMEEKAKEKVKKYANNVGVYGHNKVDRQVLAWMAEYAVRQLYRANGINAHQNIKNDDDPDLTIPKHTTLQGEHEARQEEVKAWKSGFSWDEYGGTFTEYHATKYARKERARVWCCEVNMMTGVVIVHGWLTPAEILQCETRITSSGVNYQAEVMHRVSEVIQNIEDEDLSSGWW